MDAPQTDTRMTTSVTASRILDCLAQACQRTKVDGLDSAIAWTWHHVMNAEERAAFDLFLVKTNDELAWQAGAPESRFRERVRRMALDGQETKK